MDPRRKKITPVMPSRVTTTGIIEDKVNPDNRGLYQNQMDKNEYWTYDSKLKDIVVMEIPRTGKARVKKTFSNIPVEVWLQIRTCMKEFIVDDKKDKMNEPEAQEENPTTESILRKGIKALNEYAENGVTSDVSDEYTGRYGHKFVYNYDMNRLECTDKGSDFQMGVSRPDWADNPNYWVAVADRHVEMDRVYS